MLLTSKGRQEGFNQAPDKINASEYFVASAIDINDVPQVAWFLLTFPHKYPKIKFGVFVTFKSPLILGQHQENLKVTLTVYNILGGYKISKKCITVVKT